MRMKVTQRWTRNMPSSAGGYSITISTTYSSHVKGEIDAIEKKMPNGMLVIDTDKPDRRTKYNPDNEDWYNEMLNG